MYVVKSNRVEDYHGNFRARVYVKAFRAFNNRKPGDNEVRMYLESRATHNHDFSFVDSKNEIGWSMQ